MELQKIPFEEATDAQVRDFAVQNLGLEISKAASRETIIGKMSAVGYGMPFITLAPKQVEVSGKTHKGPRNIRPMAGHKDREEVLINIHVQEKFGGDRPVPVGVNGSMMLIPRGQDVWVPTEYVEILMHAVENQYDPVEPDVVNGNNGGLREPRKVLSYPFSYV